MNVHKYLKGGCKVGGGRLFSGVPREDKGQWAHSKTQEMAFQHQKKTFAL